MVMETYNDVYLRIRRTLKSSGIENPEFEARFIVASAADRTREEILAMNKIYATDAEINKKIEKSVERRLSGEPLAYILGEWEFCGLTLNIDSNVLIPRIDTELLAQLAIKLIKAKAWQTRALDLCAGSGCIGLTIAEKIPSCRVVMADYSEQVLAVCRQNMLSCNLSRNTTAIIANAKKPPPTLLGAFDLIVSNPPYIKTCDLEMLDSSVKDYEPLIALDGGEDGFDFFRAIAVKWKKVLKPGGDIALECGIDQASEVRHILKQNGFRNIHTHKDTQGIERVITGKLQ